jgi:hypothetical protein
MVEHELEDSDVERDVAPERAAVTPADRPRRRGRWLKIVLVVVVLLVLLLALAPVWSAPIARNLVVDQVNEQIDGTLAIESLSWSYGGHVRVEGLDLRDAQGQPVMQIAAVDGHVDVLPALKGDIRAALTVDGLQADLRRQPDGRTNIESIGGGPKGEPKPKTSSGPLPQVAATVRVNDATVRVHGEDGDTELHEVTVALDLKALDQPATFDVGAALSGPGGPAGRVRLTGDVLLAQDGRLSDAPPVRVDYTLDTLRLEALAPAATLFADVPPASGRVGGSGHWEWQGGLRLSGRTELTLQSVRVEGASAGGQPLVVPDTTLTAEAQLDDAGGGRQTLALVSGTLLDLRWDGTVAGLLGERPSLEGALELGGELGGLFDLAREPLALQPGVGLSGQLAVDTRLRAEWTQQGPQSVAVQGTLGVTQLAARDAQGRPLDLGLNAVQVKIDLAAQPAAGTAALETLELQAGPLALSARGRVEGLPRDGAALDPARLAVQGGQFSADADLAPLLAAIAPLVDLHGLAAAGTVQIRGQADGSAGAVAGQAQVTVKGLALQGPDGLDVSVPGLTVDATASADERAIRLEHLVTRWEPLRAMTHAIPNGELAASATWTPADRVLDVPHWTLACPLAGGEGRLKATLGAAGAAEGAGIERLEAQVQLSGQVEPVREWLAALKPELQPARGEGQWDLTLTADVAGDRITAQPQLTLRGVGLKGYVVGGQELPLDKADVDFGAHIDFDRGAGSVKAEGLQLRAPGVELTASGQATNVLGDPTAATGALDCTWSLQPDVVTARLGALLGGLGLAGAPLSGSMRVELAPAGASAAGNLSGAEIAVTLPADAATGQPARTLVQRELKADFDLTASPWPSIDTLDVRRGEFRSSTAQATVAGRVERLSTPANASADVRFRLDAELARVLADLGPALGLPAWEASGAAVVEGKLTGDAGQLALTADGTIANCHMVLPAPAPPKSAPPVTPVAAAEAIAKPGGAGAGTAAGKPPIVIDEPQLTFGVTSQILVEPLDVTLERASIDSSFLRGKLDGKILALRSDTPRLAPLEGDFTYIPDTLGALLQPWLPVQWSGSAEQPLRFRVEGPVAKVDPVAMLGGLAADATVGLGQITAPGLTTGGQVDVKNHDGRTKVVGKLTANAGTLDLDADLDLRPEGAAPAATPPSSQVKVTLAGLQVTQELADLLARVHPLFARTAGSQVATVSGVISADLSGTWAGPLPTSGEPPGGWLGAAAKSLTASGRLDAGQLQFASSALLGEMLSAVNLPGQTQLSLAPIEFRIEQGRLSYAQPWIVNLAGMDTNFTGSVGLDLSLDLAWNVPITEQLIAKHDFLKSLAGQTIEVPITGTATKPRLEWSDALKDLAARAAKAELEKKLKDKLGGLPSIPGVTDSGADASGGLPAASPEDLLAKADKLWDEGKKAEAKPLYQELIDKHKYTLVYTLNKKRIKERAE